MIGQDIVALYSHMYWLAALPLSKKPVLKEMSWFKHGEVQSDESSKVSPKQLNTGVKFCTPKGESNCLEGKFNFGMPDALSGSGHEREARFPGLVRHRKNLAAISESESSVALAGMFAEDVRSPKK